MRRVGTSASTSSSSVTRSDGLCWTTDGFDQFAVSQRANREVYVWDHEDDSRSWVAPSVMRYLEWWMAGVIAV